MDSAKENPMGTILFFPIDCVWERVFGPFVSETVISLLKILKMFYPPMALCVTEPNWVHLTVFPYYCGWETVLILSKSPFSIGLFEILKLFYPHKGILRSKTQWGGVHLTVIPFYCVWEGVFWPFVSKGCNPPFQNIENVLYPVGVCNPDTVGGPIVFTYVLFCVRKRILDFQILTW